MEKLPYIISAELDLDTKNVTSFVDKRQLENYRSSLDTDLRKMGKDTYWISSSEIISNLKSGTRGTNLPIVSLDDRYLTGADQYLGISRGVNSDLVDKGYVPRSGYPSLPDQLKQIPALGNEIVLVDDVLYSGEMINWLNERLSAAGVTISSVIVGVAIQEGIDKLNSQGIDVYAGSVFNDVEDELCERDLAFVPGSGRRIANSNMNAIYFDVTNGRPEQWASISPESSKEFCVASLERSLRLIRPDTPMRQMGTFLGYNTDRDAKGAIVNRLGELQ
jgi:hypothetical protein